MFIQITLINELCFHYNPPGKKYVSSSFSGLFFAHVFRLIKIIRKASPTKRNENIIFLWLSTLNTCTTPFFDSHDYNYHKVSLRILSSDGLDPDSFTRWKFSTLSGLHYNFLFLIFPEKSFWAPLNDSIGLSNYASRDLVAWLAISISASKGPKNINFLSKNIFLDDFYSMIKANNINYSKIPFSSSASFRFFHAHACLNVVENGRT